ncbi:hypothetical protein ACNKHR_07385 [Shigella flexneri]
MGQAPEVTPLPSVALIRSGNRNRRTLQHPWRCLPNVGCIPSKALLHVAKVIEEAKALADMVSSSANRKPISNRFDLGRRKPSIEPTGGLAGMAKGRKVKVVNGLGKFTGANTRKSKVRTVKPLI